ncbi:uncharacterized protein EDB91DRAFT_1246031 [Suillus paluster]|uniref:uncharacterized protein n=1 Tax=Suillus paluster TaxID=48578 RepID=UPI001B875980|nr:uncharacterized protein EDB91DRAFT_1246031 [Suillus paluster]KAG1745892.1 hypothetical protein EDB91DRAFT_1246031 [Suillus paluster]
MGGLTELCGKLNFQGRNFAWKTLPALLAKRGYVIHNYPEYTLMPGEKRTMLDNSLTVQHITTDEARRRLLRSHDPVIIGEAPGSELQYSHGRCQFFNSRIDQKGLHRLISPAPSPVPSPAPSPVPSAPSHHHYQRLRRC